MSEMATCFDLDANDGDAVIEACRTRNIDFVVIGPEAPLAEA